MLKIISIYNNTVRSLFSVFGTDSDGSYNLHCYFRHYYSVYTPWRVQMIYRTEANRSMQANNYAQVKHKAK